MAGMSPGLCKISGGVVTTVVSAGALGFSISNGPYRSTSRSPHLVRVPRSLLLQTARLAVNRGLVWMRTISPSCIFPYIVVGEFASLTE
jgi:hypothetical protein